MEKGLRHLSRVELVDIICELKKSNEEKDAQIQQLQAALDDKALRIATAGSIAQAALSINGVFEAVQAAADQYLASVKAAAGSLGMAPVASSAAPTPVPAVSDDATVPGATPNPAAQEAAAEEPEVPAPSAAPTPLPSRPPAHFAKPQPHSGDVQA